MGERRGQKGETFLARPYRTGDSVIRAPSRQCVLMDRIPRSAQAMLAGSVFHTEIVTKATKAHLIEAQPFGLAAPIRWAF